MTSQLDKQTCLLSRTAGRLVGDILSTLDLLTAVAPHCNAGDQVPLELQEGCSGAALAIWTTTPWTMPANAAVAVNEKLQYSIVQAQVSATFLHG